MRPYSKVAPAWWDYTTLDPILDQAARLTAEDLLCCRAPASRWCSTTRSRTSTSRRRWNTSTAWRQATEDEPAGVCGPIGPTEQLPLVARLVNELELDLRYAHFWAMDEWVIDGKEVTVDHPLSFRRADMEFCFDRIRPELRMPQENLHFPTAT